MVMLMLYVGFCFRVAVVVDVIENERIAGMPSPKQAREGGGEGSSGPVSTAGDGDGGAVGGGGRALGAPGGLRRTAGWRRQGKNLGNLPPVLPQYWSWGWVGVGSPRPLCPNRRCIPPWGEEQEARAGSCAKTNCRQKD